METNGNRTTGRAEMEAEKPGQQYIQGISSKIHQSCMSLRDWLLTFTRGRASLVNEEVEMIGQDGPEPTPNSSRENIDMEDDLDLELSLNDGKSACNAESVAHSEFYSIFEPTENGSSRNIESNSNPNSCQQSDEMEIQHGITSNNYEPTISGIKTDEVSVRANAEPSDCGMDAENEASAHKEEYSAPEKEEIEVDLELTPSDNDSAAPFIANAESTDFGAGSMNPYCIDLLGRIKALEAKNGSFQLQVDTLTQRLRALEHSIGADRSGKLEPNARVEAKSSITYIESKNESIELMSSKNRSLLARKSEIYASLLSNIQPTNSGAQRMNHGDLEVQRGRRLTARDSPSRSNEIPKSGSVKGLKFKKKHECQFCQKSFSCHSMKIRHERVHTGEKPFSCPSCDRTFNQNSSLKTHKLLIHTKEKPLAS